MSDTICLLNCRSCEDILRLTEKRRTCECGKSTGNMVKVKGGGEEPHIDGTYARILAMQFEDYDRLVPGEVACLVVLDD